MQIIEKDIGEIKPYERNPRKNDEAVKYVAESIKQFGFKVPVVIDNEGVIVAGHTRYKACKQLGINKIPCIVADDLNDEQIKAFRLADNKVAEQAEWDLELLDFELDGIINIDMEELGFDLSDDEEEPEVEEDDYEEPENIEPRAKLGDIYQLGRHRLMCGDSTSITDVEKLMGGAKADMIHTDPPYGVNMQRSASIINDDLDNESLKQLIFEAIGNAVIVSKSNSPLYCWIGFRGYSLAEEAIKQYYKINNCIVWVKPSIGLGHKGYRYQHELCIFSGNIEDRSASDVWQIARDKSGLHPTMKPIELVAKAVTNSSAIDDNVLDLFGGSGSTLIACEQLQRNAYLMELDPHYVDVIIDRWEKYTGNKAELLK